MNVDDIHTLAGAYVLDALDPDEREAFEAYLATSPEAQAEVESLREATALLGGPVAEAPPAAMRDAVLGRIDAVRQERPVVSSAPQEAATVTPIAAARRPGGSRMTRLAWGAAAVMAAVAIGLGAVVLQLGQRVGDVERRAEQIAGVVVAADAQRVTADLPDGGVLTGLVSPATGSAVVIGHGMRELDEDQMYALWRIVDGEPLPAGELVADQPTTVEAGAVEEIGLTVEPRGPLSTPTGEVEATLPV
ncbi:anti-sigma factor domain-containing protein [Euzebya sp.]|uniref:anti-sigma factor n=1 Tax=Euzebya sp. TaxID=1971409 RepID=UPI0035163F2C